MLLKDLLAMSIMSFKSHEMAVYLESYAVFKFDDACWFLLDSCYLVCFNAIGC